MKSMPGVDDVACLISFTDHTITSNAPTADKGVDGYGSNLKNVGVCEVGGLQ